jgi:hypothetical protein
VTKQDDEARKKVLARRATFVAAALAGVSTACGKEPAQPPQPCLSVAPILDVGPQPCLSPVPPSQPDETDAGTPQPCLKVAPPAEDADVAEPQPRDAGPKPSPQPCLKVRPK